MASEHPLFPRLFIHQMLLPGTMSGFTPIVFSLFVSTGVLFQLGVYSSTSDQVPNDPRLFAASLTFFLAAIQLPFLLLTNSSTVPLRPILVPFLNYLSLANMIASLTTLLLLFLNFDQVLHWGIGLAISSGLICFAISAVYKSISRAQPGYYHCLHVAFLTLCISFAGLYTGPLFHLPGRIQYNNIIHGMNCLYHFALVPVNFFLGTILVILNVASPAGLVLPIVSLPFKEGMAVLTLAFGLSTLIIGVSLSICASLVNLAMAGGFEVGGPGGPNQPGVM